MNAIDADVQLSTVPRLFPGETIVVIGGGTSVTPDDVAYCHGRARVVAIKEAYLLAPLADVLYSCESKWWEHYQGAPTFGGLKFALLPDPQDHPAAPQFLATLLRFPDVQLLRHTGAEGLDLDPSCVRHGYNSGHQAINVAVHLGAAKIVLLGFDMSRGPTGHQNWFGAHPMHLTGSPYPVFQQHMHTLVEPLQAAGVEVVNASRFTVLTAFPRVPLEEALG